MESASCVKKVLSCKEDDRNLYAGLMCAVNFAERGRFREAIEVINVCKEAAPNNQQVLYNLAFLEYLNKNHEKSMTIIESYLQKYDVNSNEHIEMLYMLNKFKLKKFPEARRRMKLMILRNPNLYKNMYNFGALMNEYVSHIFKLSNRDPQQTDQAFLFLGVAMKTFADLKDLLDKRLNVDNFPAEWSTDRKNITLAQNKSLRSKAENKLFLMYENQNKYENFRKVDRTKEEAVNKKKEERLAIFQEVEREKEQKDLRLKMKEEEDRLENERKAELCRLLEENMATEMQDMKNKTKDPKKPKERNGPSEGRGGKSKKEKTKMTQAQKNADNDRRFELHFDRSDSSDGQDLDAGLEELRVTFIV